MPLTWTKDAWAYACCGNQEEHYTVKAIELLLMTEAERKEMFDRRISVQDILNGRNTAEHEVFVQSLFNNWNQILGWKEFGF